MSDNPAPKKSAKPLNEMEGFDALIAKRSEAIGGDGKTFIVPGFGRDWHLVAPELASAEWNDDFFALSEDFQDGLMTLADYRDSLSELLLGDQSDDFQDACDKEGVAPETLLNWAVSEHRKKTSENPTSRSSRASRRRAKRR